jgi:DNA uptake protein ComE-like DNA-binding protein
MEAGSQDSLQVNVNAAEVEELEELPEVGKAIGPSRLQRGQQGSYL